MQSFLLDLWSDLRAKRLWPVAALLAIAIAAIPFTLVKKQQPAPSPSPATSSTQGQTQTVKLPSVSLDTTAGEVPSKLQSFDTKRNPFKPLRDISKAASTSDTTKTVDLGASPKSSSSSSSSSSSGSGSSSSSSGGSSSSSGGSGSSSGGSSSGTGSSTGSVVGPQVTYYTYRADISFGKPGHEKTIKSVEKFSFLGDAKAPAAVYMGITDDTKYAVFAIDIAGFGVAGEGTCKPADDNCQFVYLGVGDSVNETTITSLDGSETYNLKLLKIKRVTLDPKTVESTPLSNDTAPTGKSSGKKPSGLTSTKGKPTDSGVPSTADTGGEPRPQSLFDVLSQSHPATDTTARAKK
jgi:hypothetical protein